MPSIQKQVPSKPAAPVASISSGGILGTAIPATQLKELYIKLCLYGRNRVGKTTLACQFPKPLLLISFEPSETGGAISVSQMEGVHYIRVASKPLIDPKTKKLEAVAGSKKALTLANELHAYNPFATVVVDTATSFQDIILQELMGLSKIPEMLSWGLVSEEQYRDRSSKTREALRPFLDLPCHVVICAQERDHNPPKGREEGSKLTRGMQGESFMAADLGGATVKWLHDACGYIGQLYEDEKMEERVTESTINKETRVVRTMVGTGKRVRRLRTLYHPNYAAGFRSSNPDAVPEYIEGGSPREMYDKLMKVVQGIKVT